MTAIGRDGCGLVVAAAASRRVGSRAYRVAAQASIPCVPAFQMVIDRQETLRSSLLTVDDHLNRD